MTWRHWLCLYAPWHGLIQSFWASERLEVCRCHRCGIEWALNHDVQGVLPWDLVKDFYRERMRAEATSSRAPGSS